MLHEHLPSEHIYTVTELNDKVKQVLNASFDYMWVRGEVSGITLQSSSGHAYFSLKDQDGIIKAAFFRGVPEMVEKNIQQGSQVEAYGRIDLYGKSGSYQFVITALRPVGLGELNRKFEELRKKLEQEGLFALERKRPIPALPKCIGLLTSIDGAAITDFRRVLDRRFPNMHLRIINVPVQGNGAARAIAASVQFMNRTKACDVIVITRGGGSMEDLWEFNSELLARTIAASEIPVISAVGHERDFTICDFAADFRAPTPSAAAEQVVQRQAGMADAIRNASSRLSSAMRLRFNSSLLRWQRISSSIIFQHPEDMFNQQAQRVDTAAIRLKHLSTNFIAQSTIHCRNLIQRMSNALCTRQASAENQLQRFTGVLKAIDPKNVLARGYSILFTQDRQAVRNAKEAPPGTELTAQLAEGTLTLHVTDSQ